MPKMIESSPAIHPAPEHLNLVRAILKKNLPNVQAFVFGSRVSSFHKKHSDLDLALMPASPLDWRTMANIREAFEESLLPLRIDVIDWSVCTEDFKRQISSKVPL
jgi:uncharacterized protein